jgi:hypothetical protein
MDKRLISERTAAAMRHKKTRHQAYAHTPYGFEREGEVLRPNPVEQAVIRQVQNWQRAGQNLHCIAEELARPQVPTTQGGQWSAGTVRYRLCNALYAEEVASDVRTVTDPKAAGRAAAGEREGRVGLAAARQVETGQSRTAVADS